MVDLLLATILKTRYDPFITHMKCLLVSVKAVSQTLAILQDAISEIQSASTSNNPCGLIVALSGACEGRPLPLHSQEAAQSFRETCGKFFKWRADIEGKHIPSMRLSS